MNTKPLFNVRITRSEFLALPIEARRRIMAEQTDDLLGESVWLNEKQRKTVLDAVELLGVALSDHGHKWTNSERRAWDKSWRLVAREGNNLTRRAIVRL